MRKIKGTKTIFIYPSLPNASFRPMLATEWSYLKNRAEINTFSVLCNTYHTVGALRIFSIFQKMGEIF